MSGKTMGIFGSGGSAVDTSADTMSDAITAAWKPSASGSDRAVRDERPARGAADSMSAVSNMSGPS